MVKTDIEMYREEKAGGADAGRGHRTYQNTANYGYLAEWGLSIFIKAGAARLLYDCGSTCPAVQNAGVLGIDLGSVDAIVLSHGHVDDRMETPK